MTSLDAQSPPTTAPTDATVEIQSPPAPAPAHAAV